LTDWVYHNAVCLIQIPIRGEVCMAKPKAQETAPTAAKKGTAAEIFLQIQAAVEENRGQAGALIPVLQKVQSLIGYLPLHVLQTISRDLNIPLSTIYGVTTFYSFFTMVPRGKHIISTCMGTSCYVRGGERILNTLQKELSIEPGETTKDGIFSLEMVRCLGCCGLAPVVSIEDKVYRRMSPTKMKEVLSSYA
jgi:NADH:ubiquinone oxidoreductase subunit E